MSYVPEHRLIGYYTNVILKCTNTFPDLLIDGHDTGEMLVGPARALFMDEISTGLDSSTTFQIVKSIRQFIHILGGTAMISLLQPAPETYELFDDIILLSDGQIVYQGLLEDVLDFFESVGFKCPERKGIADFLQEVSIYISSTNYISPKRQTLLVL
jgi:ABC-type multidrug transport system ATPase subunit